MSRNLFLPMQGGKRASEPGPFRCDARERRGPAREGRCATMSGSGRQGSDDDHSPNEGGLADLSPGRRDRNVERTPASCDRRCRSIPARLVGKRGGSKPRCPVDGGQPRARRGGGPWARRQCGGPNLKNLFGRSGTIPGSPVQWPSERGVVVQSVRMLACHAGGRGFESRPLRHLSRKARESGLSAFRGSLPAAADERARVARPGCGEPSRSAVNCRATEIEPRIDAAKTPR